MLMQRRYYDTNSQSFISREQMQHLHNYNFWWRKRPRFTVSLKAFANMRLIAATDISKIYIGETWGRHETPRQHSNWIVRFLVLLI